MFPASEELGSCLVPFTHEETEVPEVKGPTQAFSRKGWNLAVPELLTGGPSPLHTGTQGQLQSGSKDVSSSSGSQPRSEGKYLKTRQTGTQLQTDGLWNASSWHCPPSPPSLDCREA